MPLVRRAALAGFALLVSCAGPRPAFNAHEEDGVHGNVDIEWWYHYGWLEDEAGGEYAWISSFFRFRAKDLAAGRYFIYDLVDLKTGQADYRSRIGAEVFAKFAVFGGQVQVPPPHEVIAGGPAEKAGDPLRLAYGEDTLERTAPGRYRLKARGVDLELTAAAPPMAIDGTGLTGLERAEDMHYYTIPRLEAKGAVRGKKVKGLFWYDHQWGGYGLPTIGWSWWGLQLEDGTAANATVLRDTKTGRLLRATLTHDDRALTLEAKPVEWWTSATQVRYPVVWELSASGLRLRVEPMHRDRECPIPGEMKSIWEGPVRVTGSHRGRGFQELVGYAIEQGR